MGKHDPDDLALLRTQFAILLGTANALAIAAGRDDVLRSILELPEAKRIATDDPDLLLIRLEPLPAVTPEPGPPIITRHFDINS